jgi:HlyD family type I secretion membrane fusion protein
MSSRKPEQIESPTVDVPEVPTCASPVIRRGAIIVVVGALLFGLWTALAPLSAAIIAPGIVKVDRNRKVVQHQEGGIVRAILVREGERVQAGQTLIELNDIQVDAGLDLMRIQHQAELARLARLNAERMFSREYRVPEELATRKDDVRVAELVGQESRLLEVRRDALERQSALLEEQIRQTQREIEARTLQDRADAEAIRLQREELAANEKLVGEGFIAKTRILGLQRAVTDYESRRGTNQAEMAQARQRVVEIQLRISALKTEYSQQAERDLRESTTRLYDLEQRLRPTLDAARRQFVVAPVTGDIVDLRVTTIGAPIGPRDRLMDIVPSDADLLVEARVRPEDIHHVRVDAKADVRLVALLQRITPTVSGTVVHVSADRLVDPATNMAYYVAHVRVDTEALDRSGGLSLKPGMPVEVYVKTVERTPLVYLLDPVLGFLNRGLREP